MNENQFSLALRKSFEVRYNTGAWLRKMVGGPFITPGIPDLLGCVNSRFVGFECKQIKKCPARYKSKLWDQLFTPAQIDNLIAIEDAGGYARGIINLTFYSPQKALVLSPASISVFNTATLEDIEGLMKMQRMLFLTRTKGVWDIEKLLIIPSIPSK